MHRKVSRYLCIEDYRNTEENCQGSFVKGQIYEGSVNGHYHCIESTDDELSFSEDEIERYFVIMDDSERLYPFPAMLDRMQYITRWSLMRNSQPESLKQHSYDVAIIADMLCAIYNIITKKENQPQISHERVIRLSLYHDAAEILCSDLPTPIKYQNPEITAAFKQIEKQAVLTLLGLMPRELQSSYLDVMVSYDCREDALVHAADKLSAYCKCLNEEASGNHEFVSAKEALWNNITKLAREMDEVNYFVIHFLPFYGKTLDQMIKNP